MLRNGKMKQIGIPGDIYAPQVIGIGKPKGLHPKKQCFFDSRDFWLFINTFQNWLLNDVANQESSQNRCLESEYS